ncbi:MAG: hypothetical protein GYA33_05715, partial [Thermogutta sp.]|nr:hypothetical protein [Thermogutta sp.]
MSQCPRSIIPVRGDPRLPVRRGGGAAGTYRYLPRRGKGRAFSALLAVGLTLSGIIVGAGAENPKSADTNSKSGDLGAEAPNVTASSGGPRVVSADASAGDPLDTRPLPGTQPVYSLDFSEPADINYDNWPDHWTRRVGSGFPEYLKMEIVAAPSPDSPR